MLNRKLLELLKRLNASEIKRFRQFLQSPYFTYGLSSQDITDLFDHIIQYDADERSIKLDKSWVSSKLFPDKPFNDKRKSPIDTLTSDLLRLAKHFLFIQSAESESSDAKKELPVTKFYRKFGLEERFWQSVQNMRKDLDKETNHDETYFLDRYYLESEVAIFKSLYNSSEDDANIGFEAKYLEQFFTLARMELACAMTQQSKVVAFNQVYSPHLVNALMQLIRQGVFPDDNLATIYLLVIDIINEPDDPEKVNQFNEKVEKIKGSLPFKHLSNLMAFQRIFQFNKYVKYHLKEHLIEYFELSTQHLQDGILYFEGKVINNALRNITHMGLRLGSFDKIREILESHPPERIGGTRYPEEFHNLNLANYHFALKDYDKADELLNYCNFENVNFSIQAEFLLIKIYFETKNDLLESRIKALLQKVRRSKILKEHKERYFNTLNKLILIIKYGWDKKNPKRAKLAEEIRSMPGLLEREWLLEQLN